MYIYVPQGKCILIHVQSGYIHTIRKGYNLLLEGRQDNWNIHTETIW
jgi:hypothetical protein